MYYTMSIPSVEHPLEKTVYKLPTLTDCIFVSQPYGKQYYLWFTKTGCILVDRRTKKETSLPIHFDSTLEGTLMYGTIVYHDSTRCFLFDDLFFYKGEQVVRPFLQKVELFLDIVVQIQPNNFLLMLPLMSTTYQGFEPVYKPYSVKVIHTSAIYHYLDQTITNIFTVRSTPKSDIYELYTHNVLQSIAYIDTYKRSAFMNALFETGHEHRMECIWHELFKKWIPDKCV